MTTTLEAIEQFEETIKSHTTKKHHPVAKILTEIEELKNRNPAVFDEKSLKAFLEQRTKVLNILVDSYFIAKLSQFFPAIDGALFKLRRHLLLKRDGRGEFSLITDKTIPVPIPEGDSVPDRLTRSRTRRARKTDYRQLEVPLFAYVPLNGDHICNLGAFSRTTHNGWSRRTTKVQVTGKLPGVFGANLKRAYCEALSQCYSIVAEAYAHPVICDLLLSKEPQVEVGAIWIPAPDKLSVKSEVKVQSIRPRDPAMVLRVRDNYFLVKMWEVDEEISLERYMREFTTGSLKGRKL